MGEFEKAFIIMRRHGVEIPEFQTTINQYHEKEEEKNNIAKLAREKIIELNNYEPVKELLDKHTKVFVIDRGNYMYHSLCLEKEEPFDVNKLYGATSPENKRAIFAYMTIKEVNSVNPFAIGREIEIRSLLELMSTDPKFEAILVHYNSDGKLFIPVKLLEELHNKE